MQIRISFLAALVLTSDAGAEGCATIYTNRKLVATVYTSPAQSTSIELPKPYRHYNITNGDLWHVDDVNNGTPDNVLIVSPELMGLNDQSAAVQYQGQRPEEADHMASLKQVMKKYHVSNLHVYANDNTLYALTVRVGDKHPACYRLVDTEAKPSSVRSTVLDTTRLATAQARDGIQHFIDNAFSHYTWSEPEGWRGSPIENVIDDGRFTYVKLKDGDKGPMAVLAKVDGQLVIVQHVYDASKRTYRIHGTYPELLFKHGQSSLTVKRGS